VRGGRWGDVVAAVGDRDRHGVFTAALHGDWWTAAGMTTNASKVDSRG
jgi:hypothetical protein